MDADRLMETIARKYNADNFGGIYALAGDAFKKSLDERTFVRFFRRNRNGGNILRWVCTSEQGRRVTYRLEMEARDMLMTLEVRSAEQFDTIGLANAPVEVLRQERAVPTDNPLTTPFDRAVDAAARAYFLNPRAAGLSIGIIRHGSTHAFHYGETGRGEKALPNSQTRYEIGSITKTFTTTLLAQAVSDGKVGLDDDVRNYLVEPFPGLEFQGRPIRLRDLANHTSRLPTLPDDVGTQPGARPLTPEWNYGRQRFFEALRNVRMPGPPGDRMEYSNWGIALLGLSLERAYSQPYDKLLARSITVPLGMKDTSYGPDAAARQLAAVGHFENGKVAPYQDLDQFGPAGGILSDLDDMLLDLKAQLEESTPAITLTHRPTANGIGLGWGVRTVDGVREIQHNGSTYGFTSHISGFLEPRSGCVILSNSKAPLGPLIGALHRELLHVEGRARSNR
ncbi:serine hydrolase domain-containing protein [Singulisphaera rosea]